MDGKSALVMWLLLGGFFILPALALLFADGFDAAMYQIGYTVFLLAMLALVGLVLKIAGDWWQRRKDG